MLVDPFLDEIFSLPELVQTISDQLAKASQTLFTSELCRSISRVYLTGCGDSHHAAVMARLAFQQLAALPCQAMTAMEFARYQAEFLTQQAGSQNLVIAISASGRVSRTIEALRMAKQAGASTVALTGSADSPLAKAGEWLLTVDTPALPTRGEGGAVPGTRSYVGSQLALYQAAIQIGLSRRQLTRSHAEQLRRELRGTVGALEEALEKLPAIVDRLSDRWRDADQFVYCGSGPNYGTALFSAAKMLEASGDPAIGQDLEEWAHLQYFGKRADTPTIFISSGGRDESRAVEVAQAAQTIGRRVVVVAPNGSQLATSVGPEAAMLVNCPVRECFSPLVLSLPGLLFAARRAQLIGEPHFRAFGGGRSPVGGGGASRIRTSQQIDQPRR